MELSLSEIADLVGGKIVGDPTCRIHGMVAIDDAKAGEITFLANPKYGKKVATTRASAILVKDEIGGVRPHLILVDDPYYAFAQLLSVFHPKYPAPSGVSPLASIGNEVVLGEGVAIGPFVVLEDRVKVGDRVQLGAGVFVGTGSEVGDETVVYPNVTIREGVKIGQRVILHSGCVIGSDGFGFVPRNGRYHKIPQVGGVIIEDDVELGANVTVDRATLGNTLIGRGSKVDNLVQIGHNVVIGEDTILVAQVGISGSAKIGKHVILAGQAGVVGHVTIGDQVVVGARSGVTKDIAPKSKVSGFPAVPHNSWLQAQASFLHLPALRRLIASLEAKIAQLEGVRHEGKK